MSLELSKGALENGKRVFSRLYLCFNAAKDRNEGFDGKILSYNWFVGDNDGLINHIAFNRDYEIKYSPY